MRILGINAIYHDPSAALVVDGTTVAAAEEERFSRRKHGKRPVPFSAWEQPELSAAWCLDQAGLRPDELDAVTYSFDPALTAAAGRARPERPLGRPAQTYAERAPDFLATALPGPRPGRASVSCRTTSPTRPRPAWPRRSAATARCWCWTVAASGTATSPGGSRAGTLEILASQQLPHSLGLLYEDVTEHLGFLRSSDEYKVMALASYGKPRHLDDLRELVRATGDGGFRSAGVDWTTLAPPRSADDVDRRARGPGRQRADASSRRCCSTWPAGCTSRPAPGT